MKVKLFFRFFVLMAIFLVQTHSFTVWAQTGIPNTNWYTAYPPNETQYVIETPDELAGLAQLVNSGVDFAGKTIYFISPFYRFDLSGHYGVNYNGGKGWIPIGHSNSTPFKGTIAGGGHLITGLYINHDEYENSGLFGKIGGSGVVRYIGIVDADITGGNNTGSVAGSVDANNSISNCYSSGTVSGNQFVGGIAGAVSGNIENCYTIGAVSGNQVVGGVAGIVNNGGSVKNCAALNMSVSSMIAAGRVAGWGAVNTLSNNIAFAYMAVKIGGVDKIPLEKGLSAIDGEDISAAAINADGTLGGRFVNNSNPWVCENGKLPRFLFAPTMDMPEHLKLIYNNGIAFVTETGAGYRSGVSWDNAFKGLSEALRAAKANSNIKEIWVKAGTYKPEDKAANVDNYGFPTNDRWRAFVLLKDVKIYGSFAGTETSLDQRDFSGGYTSILSGDFNGDDGENFSNMNENAFHVVISAGDVGTACLDGFSITGGNATAGTDITVNSVYIDQANAGGMYLVNSSPVLTNISISGNKAHTGGGMYNENSSPILTNITISGNMASNWGGGICNYNSSSPVLTNVSISENTAKYGGGMYNGNSSSPILTNVSINANTANNWGGGICSSSSNPILTNVIISGNTSNDRGGGMYNGYSSVVLTNVTISRNTAAFWGNGMYNIITFSVPKIHNSIIWGNGVDASNNIANDNNNTPTYSHSLVEGVTTDGVILGGQTPLFVDAANGDFRLLAGSPCIDAGSNSFFNAGQTPDLSAIITDLSGNMRIYGTAIDLGAYEYPGETTSVIEKDNYPPLRQVVGYYNILGQKLLKEPTNGIFIILYDNGKTEKIIK